MIPPPQLNVYGKAPPTGVKLIAPLDPPKQEIFVTAVVVDTEFTVTLLVAVFALMQPSLLVQITVYVAFVVGLTTDEAP